MLGGNGKSEHHFICSPSDCQAASMPLCWIQQKSPTNQPRVNQQGGASHTSTTARLPSTAVTGSSLDSYRNQALAVTAGKGKRTSCWMKGVGWMDGWAAGVTCKWTRSDKETTHSQMLLTSGSLQHERKPSPSGRVMGWEAIFSLLSL